MQRDRIGRVIFGSKKATITIRFEQVPTNLPTTVISLRDHLIKFRKDFGKFCLKSFIFIF